ncbi:MAG: outer membrane beta-barrel protein [Adhaeribacter sp.]
MKKFLLLIGLSLSFFQMAFAQTDSGTLFLGGSFHLNKQNYDDTPTVKQRTTSDFSLSLQAGRFISQNLVLGLSLDYGGNSNKSTQIENELPNYSNYSYRTIATGPFVRKYIPLAEKFYFYGQGTAGMQFKRHKNEDASNPFANNYKNRSAYIRLMPGLNYFLTPKIALEISSSGISYTYYRPKNVKGHSDQLNVNLNLASLNYGVSFFLTR